MQKGENFRQINAYAMRNGIVLGLFGVATLAVFKWSLSIPFMSGLFMLMLFAHPVLVIILTMRFRNETIGDFDFVKGFLHTLFVGFYASVWVSVAVFVYLQYFDYGTIFAAYGRSIDTPETQQYLVQSGLNAQLSELSGRSGVQGLVDSLQSIGAATYAAMPLYLSVILDPFFSIIIGLICRRKVVRK